MSSNQKTDPQNFPRQLPQIGTVVRRTKSFYYVDIGETEPRLCRIRGNLFQRNSYTNKISVGDQVEIDLTAATDAGWIIRMLPRSTTLSRRPSIGAPVQVLVSNADTLLMVASLRNPPFRSGLIDRFMVAGSCGGLEPVLLLSKADLVPAAEITPIRKLYSALGCTVLVTSIPDSRGLNKLRAFLKNRTSVLSGHSGVGKSSLISALFPDWNLRIGSVSDKSGKGRHTTRMAEMFRLPIGGFIVDTPGIRELEPLVTSEELDTHFVEFNPYLGKCRFKGCTHLHEPQCNIKDALAAGNITEQRYKSYCAIFESLKA